MDVDLGHWINNTGKEIPVDFFGFIYMITNVVSSRKYIGKKQALKIVKLPPLKGKNRRRLVTKSTDWKTYMSSSDRVLSDILAIGKDKFTFEICRFCNSKSELAYYEAKLQFDNDVLLHQEEYYNGIINLRLSKIKKSVDVDCT